MVFSKATIYDYFKLLNNMLRLQLPSQCAAQRNELRQNVVSTPTNFLSNPEFIHFFKVKILKTPKIAQNYLSLLHIKKK